LCRKRRGWGYLKKIKDINTVSQKLSTFAEKKETPNLSLLSISFVNLSTYPHTYCYYYLYL